MCKASPRNDPYAAPFQLITAFENRGHGLVGLMGARLSGGVFRELAGGGWAGLDCEETEADIAGEHPIAIVARPERIMMRSWRLSSPARRFDNAQRRTDRLRSAFRSSKATFLVSGLLLRHSCARINRTQIQLAAGPEPLVNFAYSVAEIPGSLFRNATKFQICAPPSEAPKAGIAVILTPLWMN